MLAHYALLFLCLMQVISMMFTPTAKLTRSQAAAALTHILDNVLSLPSTAPTCLALTELGYDSIIDIAAMSQDEILELDYDDSGSRKKVPLKERKMLLHVVLWRDHEASKLASGLPDWMSLEADEFDTFVQVTVPALA